MKKKKKPTNDAALDAAVEEYLANLWPKLPDGTPWRTPDTCQTKEEHDLSVDWAERTARRSAAIAAVDRRRARGEKIPLGLCY